MRVLRASDNLVRSGFIFSYLDKAGCVSQREKSEGSARIGQDEQKPPRGVKICALGECHPVFSVKIFLVREKNKFLFFSLSNFERISNLKPAGRAEGKTM